MSSQLEHQGICRSDGRRVDGVTILPWKRGKSLLLDATCAGILVASYVRLTSRKAEAADAVKRKNR